MTPRATTIVHVSDGPLPVRALLPKDLRAVVSAELERAAADRVQQRVREGDATLWAPAGTPEIANRLGWLTISQRTAVPRLADELVAEGIRDVVVLGMGGSSLAPEVIRRTFGPLRDTSKPSLHVLDSTNAAAVRALQAAIDPQRTLFLVSSKSGGTIEPLSMFAHFWSIVESGDHFAAITDPGSGLERLAAEHGFRAVFHGDPDIGGRYSALSPFGIVPAALTGADARALLDGAAAAWDTETDADEDHPAWLWLGAALSAMASQGRDKLTIIAPNSLDGLGLWLEQLFAESTGKHGKGILPVADEPLLTRELRPRPRLPGPHRGPGDAGTRGCRPPTDHHPHAGPARPGTHLHARRAVRGGGRLGPVDQPLRPAQRAGGQGCDQRSAGKDRSERCARASGRRHAG